MTRQNRLKTISSLQGVRKSNVLVYVTGGQAQIGEDAVRILYRHLRRFAESRPQVRKLDLVLISRGGDVSVPWRAVSMIREFCDHFEVLVPCRAHSAATMICLGADRIVMGKKGELGPIDPTLSRVTGGSGTPSSVAVEDVSSYVSFMRDMVGITDQSALAQVIGQLATHITPLTLGTVNRQYSHIRLVARKLLTARNEKLEESKIAAVIETLTEKMYSHGHAIGRKEARDLGLPVRDASKREEELLWNLYRCYEEWLKPDTLVDPQAILAEANTEEIVQKDVPLAVVESVNRADVFEITVVHRRKRQVPSNPTINVNLNLALPPNHPPEALPAGAQQILQQLVNQISQVVPKIVQDELVRQSPVVGIETRTYGGKWVDRSKPDDKIKP